MAIRVKIRAEKFSAFLSCIELYVTLQHEILKTSKMKSKKQFFRKTAGTIVLGIMVMLFAACTKEPSKTEIIHLGDIPEEYLATVPYQNGDVVKMMHESHRQIINYHVSRGHFSSLDDPSGWYGSPVSPEARSVFGRTKEQTQSSDFTKREITII